VQLFLRTLLIFAGGLVVLAAGLYGYGLIYPGSDRSVGVADVGGPFVLIDQNGQRRTELDFAGRYKLVFFGYTYCPDVCPTTLLNVSEALDILEAEDPAKAAQVVALFFTVDPERDTPAALESYLANFRPGIVGLTGSPAEIADVAREYRAYFRKVEPEDSTEYLMDHSTFIYLMGKEGRYLGHFSHQLAPRDLANSLDEQIPG